MNTIVLTHPVIEGNTREVPESNVGAWVAAGWTVQAPTPRDTPPPVPVEPVAVAGDE